MSGGGLPPDVRMANEIAAQFTHVPFDQAATEIAEHMRSFWEPRMLRTILAYATTSGEDLDPLAAAAVDQLRRPPSQVCANHDAR